MARGRIAWAIWLGAFAVVTSTAGCSQPRLERLARDVSNAVPRDGDAVTTGRITLGIVHIEAQALLAGTVPSSLLASTRFAVQPGRERGAILGGGDTPVVALTDDRVLYARRKTRSRADKRPWVRLELDRLDDISKPRFEALVAQQNAGVLAVLSPAFVTDLLAGVLTGSIKERRWESGARHLTFNVSVDKANRELDLSDDERDDRKRLLRAFAITGDIFKATATLRSDGSLSRLTVRFVERPDKQSRIELLAELVTDDRLAAPPLAPPARETTIRVGSLAELRGSIVDHLAPAPPALPALPAIPGSGNAA